MIFLFRRIIDYFNQSKAEQMNFFSFRSSFYSSVICPYSTHRLRMQFTFVSNKGDEMKRGKRKKRKIFQRDQMIGERKVRILGRRERERQMKVLQVARNESEMSEERKH